MEKDFAKWGLLKETLNVSDKRVFFSESEIWWSAIGLNIGTEQDGKNKGFERPVYIFKKFNNDMYWGFPTTSSEKKGVFHFTYQNNGQNESIILSQIRLFDAKRLVRKIRTLSTQESEDITQAFLNLVTYKNETPPQGRGISEAEAVVPL